MKNKSRHLVWTLTALTALTAMAWGQSNSLFLRGSQAPQRMSDGTEIRQTYSNVKPAVENDADIMAQRVLSQELQSGPVLRASWISVEEPSPKDFRIHDLITIVVNEVSKHSTKAGSKAEREYEMSAEINEWFDFANGGLRASPKKNGIPKLGMEFDSDFEGKGSVSREDSLSARIQAEIIDVLPNGNIVLEASHTVITDEEETRITLTGTCRTKDVAVDNTIISSRLSNLEIRKYHKGMARDASKSGVIQKILSFLNPF